MNKLPTGGRLLYVMATYFVMTGFIILFFPRSFYELTPGLVEMGPFNLHFIRDVSFVFLVSGGALFHAVRWHKRDVAIVAAMWPVLHALFHIQIWFMRGLPFDVIWAFDFVAVIIPAFLVLWLVLRMNKTPQASY